MPIIMHVAMVMIILFATVVYTLTGKKNALYHAIRVIGGSILQLSLTQQSVSNLHD